MIGVPMWASGARAFSPRRGRNTPHRREPPSPASRWCGAKNPSCAVSQIIQAGRPGTADEVANVAELLMSGKGAFISGSTFLIDGGATASYFYGPLKPEK